MKIESIIRRDGGSRVTLGGVEYHFAPDKEGRHVAEVDDVHAAKLLAIPEGYRAVVKVEPVAPVTATGLATVTAAAAAALAPAVTLAPAGGDGEQAPAGESEQSSTGEGEQGDEGGADEQDSEGDDKAPEGEGEKEPEGETDPNGTDPDSKDGGAEGGPLDREVLARAYEEKFGRRPHGRWTAERILDELKAE